jgi:hypothetical protein
VHFMGWNQDFMHESNLHQLIVDIESSVVCSSESIWSELSR